MINTERSQDAYVRVFMVTIIRGVEVSQPPNKYQGYLLMEDSMQNYKFNCQGCDFIP